MEAGEALTAIAVGVAAAKYTFNVAVGPEALDAVITAGPALVEVKVIAACPAPSVNFETEVPTPSIVPRVVVKVTFWPDWAAPPLVHVKRTVPEPLNMMSPDAGAVCSRKKV